MKNFIIGCCIGLFFMACSSDKEGIMHVRGEIKGLKKGTIYLNKQIDTAFVAIDSISLNGNGIFSLSDKIESPEIYYLSLGNGVGKKIMFFGDVGEISIHTKLEKFVLNADIKGQKNQQLLDEYSEMMKKFRDKDLDLIKADFESKGDTLKRDSILKVSQSLLKRRYFYTTNFAVKNADAEIAPYLAITELYNANINLLDTINKSLTPEVKRSKYGKELNEFISKIKSEN
ncbi:MAG: DUF4369 domain-containing protein [Flavobacteriaceae bacterium]|nr:DUF4369 domain-containing protein [Flavobacteriaceae bacterium]